MTLPKSFNWFKYYHKHQWTFDTITDDHYYKYHCTLCHQEKKEPTPIDCQGCKHLCYYSDGNTCCNFIYEYACLKNNRKYFEGE